MDLISTNTGFTWDRVINNLYNLYTQYQNETILVNFGDSSSQSYQIKSGMIECFDHLDLIRLYLNSVSADKASTARIILFA